MNEHNKVPKKTSLIFFRSLLVVCAVGLACGITFVWPKRNGLGIAIDTSPRAQAARKQLPYDLSRLQVLNRVIHHVNKNYVAPERVSHKEMLLAGLNAIQKSVPPVLIRHEKSSKTFTVLVDNEKRQFSVEGVNSPWSLAKRFRDIFNFLQKYIDDEDIKLRDVEYAAVNGALHTLDPHSILLTPDFYTEMRMSTRGEFGGLGIVISIRDGLLTVIKPMPNSPATKSGLRAKDRIVKINDESTLNMPLQEAVNRLRGAPGFKVDVWIVRQSNRGWAKPRKVRLERAVIHIESVESKTLGDGVGYVRLKSFQGNSTADLTAALEKLHKKGLKALVLDLRDNPGGLLEQAVRVSDLFLERGSIVGTRSNDDSQRDEKFATREGTEPNYPMVVLINGGSASASEIVAGALKNHNRALIVGQRSFGKGSVQVLYDYNDGSALKLTIAQYLTPGDVSIQGVGIVPDIAIDPITVDKEDMDLTVNHKRIREEDLSRHLTSESIRNTSKPSVVMEYYLPKEAREELRENENERSGENEREAEFLINFAHQLLKNADGADRRSLLKDSEDTIAQSRKSEMNRAEKELRKIGIDWAVGPDKGPSDLSVEVSTNKKDNLATAGEPFELKVRVTNKGKAPVYQLRGSTTSDYPLFDDRELVFGKIAPGQSKKWSTTLGVCESRPRELHTADVKPNQDPWDALLKRIGKNEGEKVCILPHSALDRADGIKIDFQEAYGHAPGDKEIRTTIKALPKPQFAYHFQLADNVRGNGDGSVQRGETATFYLHVKNVGKGKTYTTQANLQNLSGRGVLLRGGRFRTDSIKPGEQRLIPFTFKVLDDFEQNKAKFEVSLVDTDLRVSFSEKFSVPIKDAAQSPQPSVRAVSVVEGTMVRERPNGRAKVVARLQGGAKVFSSEATLNGYVRIDLGQGRPGWVAANKVSPNTQTPGTGRLRENLSHQPPSIDLGVDNDLVTRKSSLRIKGSAKDNRRVRDVYIFVGSKKVFYQSNGRASNQKFANFQTEVPLNPGMNYVTVFARKNNDMIARKTIVIRRDGKKGQLLATPKSSDELFDDQLFEGGE